MRKTCILIVGPTAVGKTAVALQLAQHFQTEIISADSRQCYRELNIGVAKPAAQELALIPHHFIHSHGIQENVTAAVFESFALTTISALFSKHDVVIMAGGTGLYVKAFCEGLDELPAGTDEIRSAIRQRYCEGGLPWLTMQLQQKDPLFAEKGEMQNPQRMMRALEVVEASGRSILSFHEAQMQPRDFDIIKIGLNLPREILYERINERVDVMMAEGLLEEVISLRPYAQLNALQTVGYKELFDYFDGKCLLENAVNLIKQHTRNYAKRQLTWFRKDTSVTWFEPAEKEKMLTWLETTLQASS